MMAMAGRSGKRPRVPAAQRTIRSAKRSMISLGRVQCTRVRMDLSNIGYATDGCGTIQTTGPNGPDRVTYNTCDALGRVTMVTSGYGTSAAANDQTLTFYNNGTLNSIKDAENNPDRLCL